MGIAQSRLKLEYVEVVSNHEAHLVLAYYKKDSSIPLILDNMTAKILPITQRSDLEPILTFNDCESSFLNTAKHLPTEMMYIQSKWDCYLHRTLTRKPNFNIFNE